MKQTIGRNGQTGDVPHVACPQGLSGRKQSRLLSSVAIVSLLLCSLFTVLGCATPNKSYITGLKATNESIVFVAKTAKEMCGQGTLSEAECALVENSYNKVKLADDAVIEITQAAIIAGTNPEASETYVSAMDKLIAAMQDLLNLAFELKVLGGEQ